MYDEKCIRLRPFALSSRQHEILDRIQELQSIRAAARALGVRHSTVQDALSTMERRASAPPPSTGQDEQAAAEKPLFSGRIEVFEQHAEPLPRKGVSRYILTSAQNNTPVHADFWLSLTSYAEAIGAKIWVSTYTYNHNAFGQLSTKMGTAQRQGDLWYAEEIRPFVCDKSVEIAPGLVWCGEMNILPTASRPLSGLETYTGRKSGIFPAAKLDMKSVASVKSDPTKFNWTTGTVTLRNYIQKKAGQKAEFHHCYGALLVEVDSTGAWWVRQLLADDDGTFYDLDYFVSGHTVTKGGHRVEAITWGDVHAEVVDPLVAEVCWGQGGMLDTLRPRYQFLHDLLDFRRRNHHDRKDPHTAFQKHIEQKERVEGEVEVTAQFVCKKAHRPWVQTIVVDSNHDNAFLRWLREEDYRQDPVNARYFLEAQLRVYQAIETKEQDFHLVEWALQDKGVPSDVVFLRQDQSFVICPSVGGGIECGMHGDLGPNGSRGSPNNLMRIGRKANTGHTHSAGIYDGLWVAGLTAQMDQGYNIGPGSWSHTQIVTQPNGKRQMVTIWLGKWRA
jgi:hypothetical protein